MAKVCQVTGKKPTAGHNVSHAVNRTKRRFMINLQTQRFWVPEEKRWVKLRVTAHGIKVINRRGIAQVLREMRARGEEI